MLVLTRRVGDVIAIGDNIKVIVVSVSGKQVRLGIEADRSTTIHREEIYQKIKKEEAEASRLVSGEMTASRSIPAEPAVESKSGEKKTVIIRKNPAKEVKTSDFQ